MHITSMIIHDRGELGNMRFRVDIAIRKKFYYDVDIEQGFL